MTPTPSHIAEAERRLKSVCCLAYCSKDEVTRILAEALASPAWVPPVDPDLVLAEQTVDAIIATGGLRDPVNDRPQAIKIAYGVFSNRRAGRAAERAGGEA